MKNNISLKLIDIYQHGKNPYRGPRCRYYPSCSQYSKECYQKFNFVKASLLTAKRLLKCNPLFKGGYDPVPLTRAERLELKLDINEKNNNK